MPEPPLEVAEIFRQHGAAYRNAHRNSLSYQQFRVMRAIELCRTAALGGHVDECDACGHQRISYNSCRNRHCPKCQAMARARWFERQQAFLLPVPYFHVVFSVPEQIGAIAYQNKRVVYNILFGAVAETLRTIAADPKHLGAQIGWLAVLHTWGQTLEHHPHIHCVVPGGGLAADGKTWISCRPRFFLPVRVLSRLFRRLFLKRLNEAFQASKLRFFSTLQSLSKRAVWRRYLDGVRSREWVVYAKPPFGGPEQVLKYLARYTHRVAIANSRLVEMNNGYVSFRWKDYRHGNEQKVMTVTADEFIRRFLLHVLPKGFQRIRLYGLLSNRSRGAALDSVRHLLNPSSTSTSQVESAESEPEHSKLAISRQRCPICRRGRMIPIAILPPEVISHAHLIGINSS